MRLDVSKGLLARGSGPEVPGLAGRLRRFPWGLMAFLVAIAGAGLMALYSAVGGAEQIGMVYRQGIRFGIGLLLMLGVALADDKLYRRYAYLFFALSLLMLIAVLVSGHVGMGARRWINLGFMRLQPSELLKVTLVMALARYFHDRAVGQGIGLRDLWVPALMVALPLGLILKQPDLGTAVMAGALAGVVIFVAGLPWRAVFGVVAAALASIPLGWNWLHDYQKRRILTLFNPEDDPLGAGYHIIQSKIAVGSGGLTGKGFMNGTQSQLDFLPERHTDFIFSVYAEEWGFAGSLVLLTMYALVIVRGLYIAASARDRFGMLLAAGLTALLGLQLVINLGMVIGLLPVVGIPLPLFSYGGSSMMTLMLAMGLLAHVSVHSQYDDRE